MPFTRSTTGSKVSTLLSVRQATHNFSIGNSGTTGMGADSLLLSFDIVKHSGRMLQACPALISRRIIARSEEHTSELQSLMRITYAVFCLTKKNNITNTNTTY